MQHSRVLLLSLCPFLLSLSALADSSALHSCIPASEAQRPIPLWSTAGFEKPESVVWDVASKTYFVSNVAGVPNEKDGQGWISRVGKDGKLLTPKWFEGLHAPKGMALVKGSLWVSDIDALAEIDIANAQLKKRYEVPGAGFLNDVTALGPNGAVLVTDMAKNRIHRVENGRVSLALESSRLEGPNGITAQGASLLLATWGAGMKPDFSTTAPGRVYDLNLRSGKLKPWTQKPLGALDGLERDGSEAVFASDWKAGKVFHLKRNGACVELLEGFQGSADLTFVPATRTLVLPLMGEDRIAAYRVPAL
jgi:hypothetical protein